MTTATAHVITVEEAAELIWAHIPTNAQGVCISCGQDAPCPTRDHLHAIMFGNGKRLPRRIEGKAMPSGDGSKVEWFG